MNSGQAADLAIFIICALTLIVYNFLYIFSEPFQSIKYKWNGHYYRNLWSVGKEARAVWAGAMASSASEGIAIAQAVRNMVMGVSILAAGVALLASQLLLLITDPARIEQLSNYSRVDPITGGDELMSPQVKLGIALGILFVTLLTMTQCVRLSVHLTFLLRAVPVDPSRQERFLKIAFAVNRRASLFFSLGLRLQYAFFPFFLYILGPLALIISTVIEVICLFLMDLTPDDHCYEERLDEEREVEKKVTRTVSEGNAVPTNESMTHAAIE